MARYETNMIIEAINYNQLFYFFFVIFLMKYLTHPFIVKFDDRSSEPFFLDTLRKQIQQLLLHICLPIWGGGSHYNP